MMKSNYKEGFMGGIIDSPLKTFSERPGVLASGGLGLIIDKHTGVDMDIFSDCFMDEKKNCELPDGTQLTAEQQRDLRNQIELMKARGEISTESALSNKEILMQAANAQQQQEQNNKLQKEADEKRKKEISTYTTYGIIGGVVFLIVVVVLIVIKKKRAK